MYMLVNLNLSAVILELDPRIQYFISFQYVMDPRAKPKDDDVGAEDDKVEAEDIHKKGCALIHIKQFVKISKINHSSDNELILCYFLSNMGSSE